MSTKPSASSQRRGRISFQTSGRMTRSLSTLAILWVGLGSVLNLLLDSAGVEFASLLLLPHCGTSRPAVVCSGRGTSVFAGAFSNLGAVAWLDRHARRRRRLLSVHHVASCRFAQASVRTDRPQSQGFPAIAAHPERPEPAGGRHARHDRQ